MGNACTYDHTRKSTKERAATTNAEIHRSEYSRGLILIVLGELPIATQEKKTIMAKMPRKNGVVISTMWGFLQLRCVIRKRAPYRSRMGGVIGISVPIVKFGVI